MRGFILLLMAILAVITITESKKRGEMPYIAFPPARPAGGAGRSSCVIKGRSIEILDDYSSENWKQADPTLTADDEEYDDDDDDVDDDEPSGYDGDENYPSADDEYDDDYYEEPYNRPYPIQYGGGMMRPSGPGGNWNDPTTSLSVSSIPNFAGPLFESGDKTKYKYKRKRGGGKGKDKKKRGNINCIIITRGAPQIIKTITAAKEKEPPKLFGWLPLTSRRRRSIAHNLRALKST